MFDKKGKKELKKCEEVRPVEEKIDIRGALENVIVPVIFTSVGDVTEPQLVDLPFLFSADCNSVVMENAKFDVLPYNVLYNLDRNAKSVAINQCQEYIINTSFANFCSALDVSDPGLSYYLQYIPVKEYVYKELLSNFNCTSYRDYKHNNELGGYTICDFFNSKYSHNTVNVCTKEVDNKMAITIEYCNHVTLLIGQAIMNTICFATERAINDIILQVYQVPNINNIYDKLCSEEKMLSQIRKQQPENFPTAAAMYLKNRFRPIIEDVVKGPIHNNISSVIHYNFLTGNTIYKDELSLRNKNRRNDYDDEY